jgi:hypothetical protein
MSSYHIIAVAEILSALNGLNYMYTVASAGKQCLYLPRVWPWFGDVWGNSCSR